MHPQADFPAIPRVGNRPKNSPGCGSTATTATAFRSIVARGLWGVVNMKKLLFASVSLAASTLNMDVVRGAFNYKFSWVEPIGSRY